MKFIYLLLLFSACTAYSQPASELAGLSGKIEKIELKQYYNVQLHNKKWIIGNDKYFKKTTSLFNAKGLLLKDSIGYVSHDIKFNSFYLYNNDKLITIERKDSIGTLLDSVAVEWTDTYSAILTQYSKDAECLYKLYWFFNKNYSLNKYFYTKSCNHTTPEADIYAQGTIYYDKNGLRSGKTILDEGLDMTVSYKVIERDKHGNPTAVILTRKDAKSREENDMYLYKYTYFNEKIVQPPYKKVVFVEDIDEVISQIKAEREQSLSAEVKKKAKAPAEERQENARNEAGSAQTVTDRDFDKCVSRNRYSAKRRRKFYPFNVASKVALVSYNDAAIIAELYSDSNKFPDLSKVDKVVFLNDDEVDDLTNTIYNTGYAKPQIIVAQAVDCAPQKNAIVFLDDQQKPFEYILLYFGCDQYEYSSNKVKDGEYCREKFELLKQHFILRNIQTAP